MGAGYFRRWPSLTIGPHLSFGEHDGTIVGVPYALKRWTASVFLLRRLSLGFSEVEVGLAGGLSAISERIDVDPTRLGWAPGASALLAIELPITRSVAVRVLWSAGGELLRVDDRLQLTPELSASLGPVFRK